MKLRAWTALMVFIVLSPNYACINPQEIETLKEQVRIEQRNITELQKRIEEHAMRLEGIDNSLQMVEQRLDDDTERIESLRAGLAAGEKPAAPPPAAGTLREAGTSREAAAPEAREEGSSYIPRSYTRPEDLYNSAYGHFEKGEYGQAILEFEEYVANYGNSELADNAQYWIGECYYDQKDYKQAIREFEKVERQFPSGNKVPAAKLKMGLAYREQGKPEEAEREMTEVINRYPDSEEAVLAREKLKLWKP